MLQNVLSDPQLREIGVFSLDDLDQLSSIRIGARLWTY